MSVPLAFQLFSTPDRVAMEVYGPIHPDLEDCDPTKRFIQRVDKFIESMMSGTGKDALCVDCERYKAISEFLEYLKVWEATAIEQGYHFLTKKTCHGLKVTLKASLEIMQFLTYGCNFEYLMTSRLNQDALERFFGMVRGACGSNDHPDSLLFAQVFRLMSTYSLVKPPKGSNVDGTEFLKTIMTANNIKKEHGRLDQWHNILDSIIEKGTSQYSNDNSLRADNKNQVEQDHNYCITSTVLPQTLC